MIGRVRLFDGLRPLTGARALRDALAGLNLATYLYAVSVRQTHIEDGHVGLQCADLRQPLFSGAGLADDLHVILAVDEGAESGADQLVIVKQEDTNHHVFNPRMVASAHDVTWQCEKTERPAWVPGTVGDHYP